MTIGVFDSGVGGLTVAREIRTLLPEATLIYLGDSIHAPYGSRSEAEIQRLSLGMARFLLTRSCELLVVACNTATAAAVQLLRQTFPATPIVGMEPAVKPAAAATKSGVVGVLATVGTLQSARFAALLERDGGRAQFLTRACPGWVEAVEAGELDTPLIAEYVSPLLEAGADTLVLGCTHYPALRPAIERFVGPSVRLIDTGEAVARRVASLLPLRSPERDESEQSERFKGEVFTTGEPQRFAVAARAILDLDEAPKVRRLVWRESELTDAEDRWAE